MSDGNDTTAGGADTTAGGQDTTAGGADDSLSLIGGGDGAPAPLDFSKGRPADFPEEFWNADKNAPDIDKVYGKLTETEKRAKGLRDKLAKGETGTAPEKIEDYGFDFGADIKPEEKAAIEKAIPNDDPLLKTLRESAKEAGVSKEVFAKIMSPVIKQIAGLKDKVTEAVTGDPTPEQKAEYIKTESAKLGVGGPAIVASLGAWKAEQVKAGLLSPTDIKAFNEVTETADGVRFMNRLIQRMGAPVVPHDVNPEGAASLADYEKKASEAFNAGNEAEYNKNMAHVHRIKGTA